jgi:hypothetical protein
VSSVQPAGSGRISHCQTAHFDRIGAGCVAETGPDATLRSSCVFSTLALAHRLVVFVRVRSRERRFTRRNLRERGLSGRDFENRDPVPTKRLVSRERNGTKSTGRYTAGCRRGTGSARDLPARQFAQFPLGFGVRGVQTQGRLEPDAGEFLSFQRQCGVAQIAAEFRVTGVLHGLHL